MKKFRDAKKEDAAMFIFSFFVTVNELLAVLPTPMVPEKGASASIPHSSNSQHEPCQKDRNSESASTVALAGSMLSEAQETSHRSVWWTWKGWRKATPYK